MKLNDFDLKALLDHFSDIGARRYGSTLELGLLEQKFRPIKDGKEELSIGHIKAIQEDYAFLRWWKMPDVAESEFLKLKGVFQNAKSRNILVIETLYEVLKNIEITSCILRFIDPYNYAIFTPPVENLLNIKGKDQYEKYTNYLEALDEINGYYENQFDKIAEVDMALWALANILNSTTLKYDSIYRDIYESYRDTPNIIKRIMARNSLKQIWEEQPLYIDLAILFQETDLALAVIIAGKELENSVKALSTANGIKLYEMLEKPRKRFFSVPELAERLLDMRKIISRDEYENINIWWNLRCSSVHQPGYSPEREGVEKMILGIKEFKNKYGA